MADVEIYYADMCGLCHQAMDVFREKGIEFEAYRLEWDGENNEFKDSEYARELYRRCGEKVDFVPQFFIHGEWISGWAELEPMIQSGEFDKMLQREERSPSVDQIQPRSL